jgi:putative transposase
VNAQIETFAGRVGLGRACRAFGVSPRTWRHRRQAADGRLPARPASQPQPRPVPAWTLPAAERDRIRALLCSPRFCDLAPAQVFNTLLDQGVYLCSESTMYRILRAGSLSGERRRGHRRHRHAAPVLRATGPNQVWTWDISYLRGPARRQWFYLYAVIDMFSRKIVAWTVDTVESEVTARRLLDTAWRREGLTPDALTIHSDRGAPMTSHTLAELFETLGVTRSLSRPRTSNDNPYSEATFKTVKYRPDYPDRFETIGDVRAWMQAFVHWHNHIHYHSGIGGHHPAAVHDHSAQHTTRARQAVLDHAYAANPARFHNRPPTATPPPKVAWINKPTIHTETGTTPATTH